MNNEAFRTLINKQRQSSSSAAGDGNKSTKEIAREAVENEFQKKRQRRGGGGGGRRGRGFDEYGSDSGSGSSDDEDDGRKKEKDAQQQKEGEDDNNEPEWKRRRKEKRLKDKGDDGGESYRDRAKERREGKNADYASLQGLTNNHNQSGEEDRRRQAELSKYLGGDEEHTHLVRGLDKALAEKVRREDMGMGQQGSGSGSKETGDLDDLLEDAYAQKKIQLTRGGERDNHDWQSSQPKTELGKSMLEYLVQKKKSANIANKISGSASSSSLATFTSSQIQINPTIQKSIQQSAFSFSLNSDPRRRTLAWEVPKISVRATFGARDGNSASNDGRATPLNKHMIDLISKKLDASAGVDGKGKEKNNHNGGKNYHEESANDKQTSLGGHKEKDDDQNNNSNPISGKDDNAGAKSKEDDSDDDIFADAGEYVPQAAMAPKTSEATSTTAESNDNHDNGDAPNGFMDDKKTATKDEEEEEGEGKLLKQTTKQSIFDNLLPEVSVPTTAIAATQKVHKPQQQRLHLPKQKQQQYSQNKHIIDRDIFGGQKDVDESSSSNPYHKRRGPQVAEMEGISMANYGGGYGEEMDVDFGGDDDYRRDKKKGKEDDEEDEKKGDGDGGDDEED